MNQQPACVAKVSGDTVRCEWSFQGESLKHFLSRKQGRAVDSPNFEGPRNLYFRVFSYPKGQRGSSGDLSLFVKWQKNLSDPSIKRIEVDIQLLCSEGDLSWNARKLLPPPDKTNTAWGKIAFAKPAHLAKAKHLKFTAIITIIDMIDYSSQSCKGKLEARQLRSKSDPGPLAAQVRSEESKWQQQCCQGCSTVEKQLHSLDTKVDHLHSKLDQIAEMLRVHNQSEQMSSSLHYNQVPQPIKDGRSSEESLDDSFDYFGTDPPNLHDPNMPIPDNLLGPDLHLFAPLTD